MNPQSKTLTRDEADAFGGELDALRQEVVADLGKRDVAHIRRVIRAANRSETAGRMLLHFGLGPVSFVLGTSALGLSKILENMEIGHNIMHGQYATRTITSTTPSPTSSARTATSDIASCASRPSRRGSPCM